MDATNAPARILVARRAGPLAAGALALSHAPARGRVASVHRRAVNLLFDSGPLIALLPEGSPLHPWALTVAFDPAWIAEGAEVLLAAGDARAGRAESVGAVLRIGAVAVRLDDLEVPSLRVRTRPTQVSGAWSRLDAPAEGAFETRISGTLARFREGGPAQALAELIGLGEGLTPSGDDVVAGALAGLDFLREAAPSAAGDRAQLAEAVRAALPCGAPSQRTTRLSSQMLLASADGRHAEPVLDLLEALATDAGTVPGAVAGLLAVGHRSGADTLRGIAAALARAGRQA